MNYTDIIEDCSGFDDLTNDRQSAIPIASQDHLPLYKILGISCSLIIFQVAYSIELSIITPMMTSFHFARPIIFVAWFLSSLLSFFMHPLFLYFSNLTHLNFGRRKLFILIGGINILLCLVSLFIISGYSIKINEMFKLKKYLIIAGFLLTFLILHLSIIMVQVPSQKVFSEVIPSFDQKYAKSVGSLVSSFSSILTLYLGGFGFSQYIKPISSASSDLQMFTNDQLYLIICFFIIFLSLIFCLVSIQEPFDESLKNVISPFKEFFQVMSSRPKSIIWICIIYIFSWIGYFPYTVLLTNYFSVSNSESGKCFGMNVIVLSQVFELLSSFVVPKIVDKINAKRTYAISMSLMTLLLVASFIFVNKFALMTFYALIGVCPAAFKAIPHMLIHIIVPYEQLSIHQNILNSAASIGKMISMLIVLSYIGFFEKASDRFIIASGSLFSLISAILCYWMILPIMDIEHEFSNSAQNKKKIFG